MENVFLRFKIGLCAWVLDKGNIANELLRCKQTEYQRSLIFQNAPRDGEINPKRLKIWLSARPKGQFLEIPY